MAKKYRNGGRKAYRGSGRKSGGYQQRSFGGMSRGNRGRGAQTVRVVIQQAPQTPHFYLPGQPLPGPAQSPVGFGPNGLMAAEPKGPPKKSKF